MMKRAGYAFLICGLLLAGCAPGDDAQTGNSSSAVAAAQSASTAPALPPAPTSPRQYTKEEFRALVMDKPKAQVVELLGPPSNVIEANREGITDFWYYWPDSVRIYDPDAQMILKESARVDISETGVVAGVHF